MCGPSQLRSSAHNVRQGVGAVVVTVHEPLHLLGRGVFHAEPVPEQAVDDEVLQRGIVGAADLGHVVGETAGEVFCRVRRVDQDGRVPGVFRVGFVEL